MAMIADPPLRGSGKITGVFFNPTDEIAAVASAFPLLANPRARAAYGGQVLRHRVALYRRGNPVPFAAFDGLRHPVNDVAFHPAHSVVAISSGSYDGGYMFEGDLQVWDWLSGQSRRPFQDIPEVVRCAWNAAGDRIEAWVRPWDEEWAGLPEDRPEAAFDTLFIVRAPYGANIWSDEPRKLELSSLDIAPEGNPSAPAAEPLLAQWLGLPRLARRGAIHDLAWLDERRIAVVHDGCLLEIHDTGGGPVTAYAGTGHGSEIIRSAGVHVHVVESSNQPGMLGRQDSRLYALSDGGLNLVREYQGEYTFSASSQGQLLARRNRVPATRNARDVLRDLDSREERRVDLGHYDCFNHYLRIDGAHSLFCVQGTPASSHEAKRLCRVSADGEVQPLWPVLKANGKPDSHAMELCGCHVDDRLGEGLVISGRHYSPAVRVACAGFIYRKPLDRDREIWRHPTTASASAVIFIPACGLVAASFLDGGLLLLDAASGDIRLRANMQLDGLPALVHAMDAQGDKLAMGTADGRIAVNAVGELLARGTTMGWVEIG
ncbi:hypothetical protein LMG26858_01874 [Achromobacter anxifer]|uniref:Uncharacterized protein n=2 Tax=Achromobacter anxifer TaxID=1287737 RepID=A0A6S7DJD1_9BURK|nr:hypothetical protein LMG26858_01874 [Achromobacter anxifer]CAB5517412.1 hypothetical protein LMG26857_06507 [Achromobacter anxifer]